MYNLDNFDNCYIDTVLAKVEIFLRNEIASLNNHIVASQAKRFSAQMPIGRNILPAITARLNPHSKMETVAAGGQFHGDPVQLAHHNI